MSQSIARRSLGLLALMIGIVSAVLLSTTTAASAAAVDPDAFNGSWSVSGTVTGYTETQAGIFRDPPANGEPWKSTVWRFSGTCSESECSGTMVDPRWPSGTAQYAYNVGSGSMSITPVSFGIPCDRNDVNAGTTAVTVTPVVTGLDVRDGRLVGFDVRETVTNTLGAGCDDAGGSNRFVNVGTVVAPAASSIPAESTEPSEPAKTADRSDLTLTRTTPSVLSSLRDVDTVKDDDFARIGIVAVVFGLLVLIPSTLLNNATAVLFDRIGARLARKGERRTRWWQAAVGVAIAAVVSGFVDPAFGLDEGSARTLLSIFVAFVFEVIIGWTIVGLLMKRAVRGSLKEYSFKWPSLLIVAGTVAIVRLTGVQPGLVFGLVGGIAFGALVSRAANAWTSLLTLGYGLALGVGAWFAYSAMGPQDDATGLFISESLAALTLAGIAGLPIALLPLTGWEGRPVLEWSRVVWAVTYLVGMFAFVALVVPVPSSFESIDGPLRTWLIVFGGYFVVGVVAWLLTRSKSTSDA